MLNNLDESIKLEKNKLNSIKFWKMQGCGNDFVVLDNLNQSLNLSLTQIKEWADRRRGIGFDQLLLLENSLDANIDFNYRIFNADGTEVGQCGNGARCVTVYAIKKQLTHKKTLHLRTHNGILVTTLLPNDQVQVEIPPPQFEPAAIPFITLENQPPYYIPRKNGGYYAIDVVNLGNPHGIVWSEETIASESVQSIGLDIQSQRAFFPEGINVGLAQRINHQQINLRVYERGAGETLACGSGACAAVVTGICRKKLANEVTVNLLGGTVIVRWAGGQAPIFLEGPVSYVFCGEISI